MRALLLVCAVGCSADAPEIREDERAPRGAGAPTFDCGALEVPVRLDCRATVRETEERLTLGPTPSSSRTELECEISNGSPGRELASEVTAWCDDTPSFVSGDRPPSLTRGLHVRGLTSAGCPYDGVNAARQGLGWTAALDVPAGSHQLQVVALSNRDRSDCTVSLGDTPTDPIRAGRSRQALAYVDGPTRVPVELRCEVAARARCENTPGEPVNDELSLDVFIVATEVE
jgi:hypothetical protein